MKSQLTQEQIDNGGEILAVYMGWEVSRGIHGSLNILIKDDNEYYNKEYVRLDLCWNVLHEVWEKIRDEYFSITDDLKQLVLFKISIKNRLTNGTKQDTFTALVDCVNWINSLK